MYNRYMPPPPPPMGQFGQKVDIARALVQFMVLVLPRLPKLPIPSTLSDPGVPESRTPVRSRELQHLGNGTSYHRNENPKALFNTNFPPKLGKNHLRNHFRPLESVFSAIATYKTLVWLKKRKSCQNHL